MKVANAPVSWGVMEFELEGERYGYGQVLDEIRATGYEGTELGDWGFMPTDPEELRREVAQRELALVGAFVPVNLRDMRAHEDGKDKALRTARLLAEASPNAAPLLILSDDNGRDEHRVKIAGRVRPEDGLSQDEWEVFSRGASSIARQVRDETGLRTVFHHHCAGFVEAPWEVGELMDRTDPGLIGLCLDTGHYRYGGGDPLQAISEFGSRIWHVHLKDLSPQVAAEARQQGWDYFKAVEQGVFCELGQGDVDFAGVVGELRSAGYDAWMVVEQDILPGMGTPIDSARRNRRYLEQLGV